MTKMIEVLSELRPEYNTWYNWCYFRYYYKHVYVRRTVLELELLLLFFRKK